MGEAAGALLVDEEGVHPEVEQFVAVDVPRPETCILASSISYCGSA